MRREQLEQLIGEAARSSGGAELIVIGSQSVHAATTEIPAEVVMSLECDFLFKSSWRAPADPDSSPTQQVIDRSRNRGAAGLSWEADGSARAALQLFAARAG